MTRATVTVRTIGTEEEPVAVIDGFARNPDALRAAAAIGTFARAEDGHYPGVGAGIGPEYLAEQGALLATVFKEVFGIASAVSVLQIGYAIVTTSPVKLMLEQRLPHVDALESGRLALIHYLVPGGCDGTAFYRHLGTGFETVDAGRSGAYFAQLNDDLRTLGAPDPAYLDGDTPIFERTAHFEGIYNRALVYRGRMLHSGAIDRAAVLDEDPRVGRLTITGFFAAR